MQEFKGALQSVIVPLAGVWVAAGKALISGTNESTLPEKPLETWEELKHAATDAIAPLMGMKKVDQERNGRDQESKPPADVTAAARDSRPAKSRRKNSTTSAKGTSAPAKKKSGAHQSRGHASKRARAS